jgi:AAA family ATP:ADP antiporter
MKKTSEPFHPERESDQAQKRAGIRSAFLFVNFFLIITAYYHLKPASRSLFIESLGADRLPYVWIGTALTMIAFIGYYNRLVARRSRLGVVLGSCIVSIGLLLLFRFFLGKSLPFISVCFYVFVDILSVILVEQFWSLTDTTYSTREGKSWYGLVGTGGLLGGVTGGAAAAFLIKKTPLKTVDLLLVAAFIIFLILILTGVMSRLGLYREKAPSASPEQRQQSWRRWHHNRYVLLIAAILLLSQLVSPLVEFQFLKTVGTAYQDLETRTAFLGTFFSILGLVSIAVNLGVTPIVHRTLGAVAGLLVQPLAVIFCSWGFMLRPTLSMIAVTKIGDRGLSYSINRASRELLYIPIDPVMIYQAKAWIDMFGYRLFKVAGSLLILLSTQWLPLKLTLVQLSWLTLCICGIWVVTIVILRRDYHLVLNGSPLRAVEH